MANGKFLIQCTHSKTIAVLVFFMLFFFILSFSKQFYSLCLCNSINKYKKECISEMNLCMFCQLHCWHPWLHTYSRFVSTPSAYPSMGMPLSKKQPASALNCYGNDLESLLEQYRKGLQFLSGFYCRLSLLLRFSFPSCGGDSV